MEEQKLAAAQKSVGPSPLPRKRLSIRMSISSKELQKQADFSPEGSQKLCISEFGSDVTVGPYYAAIRIAPVMAILGVVSGIARPIFLELTKLRVCESYFNYTDDVCGHLTNHSHLAESQKVQAMTAQYRMYEGVIECVPAIIFSWFIGPWSDEYGRKLPMFIPFFGMTAGYGLAVLFSYVPVAPAYLLIGSVVISVAGGELLIHTVGFSYIADYTTTENRAPNIAIADGMNYLMRGLGVSLGGYLASQYGIGIPFALIVALTSSTLVYIVVVIKDSAVHKSFREARLVEVFSLARLKDSWSTLTRKRTGNNRLYLWLVLGSIITAGAVIIGDVSIMQLYLMFAPFYWTLVHFTNFTTVTLVLESLVMILTTVVLRRYIRMPDNFLALFAGCSAIGSLVILAASRTTWMVYLSSGVGVFKMMSIVAIRSLLIGLVDQDESGKILSAMNSVFAIVPILGIQIFTNIFTHTNEWWSGFCFLLGAILLCPCLAVFVYLHFAQRRDRRRETELLGVKLKA